MVSVKNNFYVDKTDTGSIELLIDAFNVRDTEYERPIRQALNLHDRSFIIFVDHLNHPNEISPIEDPFTFNLETGELVVFTEDPEVLLDAILEMAMFLRGFNTLLGEGKDWHVQLAIGAWKRVRQTLEEELLDIHQGVEWQVTLNEETVQCFDPTTFTSIVYLASAPNVSIDFPAGTSAQLIIAYQRLRRIMEGIAFEIGLNDYRTFNRRLDRAIKWVEQDIAPGLDFSPFDDLLTPEGWNPEFFADVEG